MYISVVFMFSSLSLMISMSIIFILVFVFNLNTNTNTNTKILKHTIIVFFCKFVNNSLETSRLKRGKVILVCRLELRFVILFSFFLPRCSRCSGYGRTKCSTCSGRKYVTCMECKYVFLTERWMDLCSCSLFHPLSLLPLSLSIFFFHSYCLLSFVNICLFLLFFNYKPRGKLKYQCPICVGQKHLEKHICLSLV